MIKEILDGYAKSPAMETVFLMDRQRTIGASEIGQCARRMFYVKTANLPDPDYMDNWGAKVRGKVIEQSFWLPAMRRRFRKKLLVAGKKQTTVHDRYLSATPDGLLVDLEPDFLAEFGIPDIGPSRSVLVECKSIDPRVNLGHAKAEHILQVQTGLGLIRELTRHKPDYALVSYVDASFWDDVDEFPVRFDENTYARMHDRAVKIKTAAAATDLKPEGWIAGGKECEYCPFARPCGIERRSLPEVEAAADPQFAAEITDMCRAHEATARQIKTLEANLNEQKDAIKSRLRAKNVRRLPKIVTWYPVKGRDQVDMTAFKAAAYDAGVDAADYTTAGEPTDALRVTLSGAPTA